MDVSGSSFGIPLTENRHVGEFRSSRELTEEKLHELFHLSQFMITTKRKIRPKIYRAFLAKATRSRFIDGMKWRRRLRDTVVFGKFTKHYHYNKKHLDMTKMVYKSFLYPDSAIVYYADKRECPPTIKKRNRKWMTEEAQAMCKHFAEKDAELQQENFELRRMIEVMRAEAKNDQQKFKDMEKCVAKKSQQEFSEQPKVKLENDHQNIPKQHFSEQPKVKLENDHQNIPKQHFSQQPKFKLENDHQNIPKQHFSQQPKVKLENDHQNIPKHHFSQQPKVKLENDHQNIPKQHFSQQPKVKLENGHQNFSEQHFSQQPIVELENDHQTFSQQFNVKLENDQKIFPQQFKVKLEVIELE
ncbi:hypothetical protein CHUAL_004863 [Chamberlinius hualienensis]